MKYIISTVVAVVLVMGIHVIASTFGVNLPQGSLVGTCISAFGGVVAGSLIKGK